MEAYRSHCGIVWKVEASQHANLRCYSKFLNWMRAFERNL